MTDAFQLHQMVDQPMRGPNILDLFFTTSPGLVNNTQIGPGLSDYDTVIMDHSFKAPLKKNSPRTIYHYSKANWDAINEDLDSFLDEFMNTDPDTPSVTTNSTTIKCHLFSIMDKYIPHTTTKERDNLPYITWSIKREIRCRKQAHTKAKRFNYRFIKSMKNDNFGVGT